MNDVKELLFRLRLSREECSRLSVLSARAGITPEKLLERFIDDLLRDDEGTLAPQWFKGGPLSDLWYDPLSDPSSNLLPNAFTVHLANDGMLAEAVETLVIMDDCRLDIAFEEGEKRQRLMDDADKQEAKLRELYDEYVEISKEEERAAPQNWEEALHGLSEYQRRLDALVNT